jgi:hypothetical protein
MKLLSYTLPVLFILTLASCADALMGDELDESIYLNYQTITDLELPFEEEWFVANGGKTHREGAHHFLSRQERYAYDIFIVKNGRTHSGNGSKNEDYYCFGKRLNAPSDGKIIELINNIDDNLPGTVSENTGNYIIIDHLNGENSVMVHFQKGSIIVSVGDTVVKGQEVGKAGNSGNSTEPHLHYHLQGSSGVLNEVGVPAQFLDYYENGEFVERGQPVRAQKVRKN